MRRLDGVHFRAACFGGGGGGNSVLGGEKKQTE